MFKYVFLLMLLFANSAMAGDKLYQYSTIDALLNALYDGQMPMSELKKHGDFGIGTLSGLDGELAVLDGVAYHVSAGGDVVEVGDADTTPFATVSYFDEDFGVELSGVNSIQDLNRIIFDKLPTHNVFFAIRIDGEFNNVKTRAIPKQKAPYEKLAKVVDQQVIKTFSGEGTLIGYFAPSFVKGINVSGFHWHYLNKERTLGGHVLDCSIKTTPLFAKVDELRNFEMSLPNKGEFDSLNLSEDMSKELHKVEKSS